MKRKKVSRQHELSSLDALFRDYHHKIYGLALSITANEADAQDVVQNVFVKLLKKRDSFKGKSSLATWIYRIAYNETLQLLRKRSAKVRSTVTLMKPFPAKVYLKGEN